MVRSGRWWLGQILPPLLILPLAIAPPDFPMAILWIIGWLAFMVSLINLLRMLVRSRRLGFSAFKPSLRPILTIVFVLFAQLSIQMSVARANEFGRKAAEEIQQRCHTEQVCPASISGWSPRSDTFVSETFAGALAKYRVLYSVSGDRKQFSVLIRHDIDRGLLFIGGVDKELHESSKGP
jgi:hypothetical protein